MLFLEDVWRDQKGIRSRKLKKDREHKAPKQKNRKTNSDLQNMTQKTKDRAARAPLKEGMNSGSPEGLSVTPVVQDLNDTNIIWTCSRYAVERDKCYLFVAVCILFVKYSKTQSINAIN